MKSEIRMAFLTLAAAAAPAIAQDATPQCASLFDSNKDYFTVMNAPDGARNQQCFLTVLPKDGPTSDPNFPTLAQYPAPQLREGTYEILLSGGGGGGGGGSLVASGGGGAGALPSKTSQYLTPGIYKLTIGTGGHGGTTGIVAARGEDGNPTSVTKAYTNETVAGFPGADVWAGRRAQNYMVASTGRTPSAGNDDIADGAGARGVADLGDGGAGGRRPNAEGGERAAQDGTPMILAGIPTGRPGHGGSMDGGGGGGAGYGDGGDGPSGDQANTDRLPGGKGGDGFVALRPIQLAQATPPQPEPRVIMVPAETPPKADLAPMRAHKQDRN